MSPYGRRDPVDTWFVYQVTVADIEQAEARGRARARLDRVREALSPRSLRRRGEELQRRAGITSQPIFEIASSSGGAAGAAPRRLFGLQSLAQLSPVIDALR